MNSSRRNNASLRAFAGRLKGFHARVEHALDTRLLSATAAPSHLHAAMRYATLEGGKRVRASLVYATGEAVGAPDSALDVPAGGGGGRASARAGRVAVRPDPRTRPRPKPGPRAPPPGRAGGDGGRGFSPDA